MQDVNPLKKINLEQYQKPKTLIVVHYKGKRISVPLLGDCRNLTHMLYHHIDKFQQTVLRSDPKWEILSQKKIVCFCSSSGSDQKVHKQSSSIKKNIQKYLKYSDGDLKIDILLSLIRIEQVFWRPALDITKYYKYMEIRPYFVDNQMPIDIKRQSPMLHKYYLYRLIEKNKVKNVYLARNLQDGHFYSIKVYRSSLSMAEHQARFLNAINTQMQQKIPTFMNNQSLSQHFSQLQESIVSRTQIHMIPSEQEEDEDEDQTEHKYKHLAIISKYYLRGKLSDKIHDKNSRITENDLLKYLKQLVGIAYKLHEEYNIIHRNLTPESFEIDESGDLKLTTFSSWLQCYDQDGQMINYPLQGNSCRSEFSSTSRIYEEEFQFVSNGWYQIGQYTPVQVASKSKQGYNKFVDFYTIGVVIKQIYQKVYEFQNKSQNSAKSKIIQKMVSGLTSTNLKQRQEIVLQIIQGINKSKSQQTQRKNQEISLNLSEIRLGQLINIDNNQTCVQNQTNDLDFNGISHQEIINFFKPIKQIKQSIYEQTQSHYQTKKQQSREKKKIPNGLKISRGQISNVSNSRDKSVKSVKSNKSKDKTRTKSKLLVQKAQRPDKNQKIQNKSKSKSHKKLISPERNSFNTNAAVSSGNSKLTRTYANEITNLPLQKKSKSKSCDKIKSDKSPDKRCLDKKSTDPKSKDKNLKMHTHTINGSQNSLVNGTRNNLHQTLKHRGANIPLPKTIYKSPGKYV